MMPLSVHSELPAGLFIEFVETTIVKRTLTQIHERDVLLVVCSHRRRWLNLITEASRLKRDQVYGGVH